MSDYIFVVGYTGHYTEDKEVLHIVDNDEDLKTVAGWYVDHKIVDEKGARNHIQLSKRLKHVYATANLNYVDEEIFEHKYTELELILSATKNEIALFKSLTL